jgi:hypothetical protein
LLTPLASPPADEFEVRLLPESSITLSPAFSVLHAMIKAVQKRPKRMFFFRMDRPFVLGFSTLAHGTNRLGFSKS